MTITANWSYPTAIKFGAGRIKELADHCKAVGIKRPLAMSDAMRRPPTVRPWLPARTPSSRWT